MPRTAKYDRQEALGRAVELFWERGYFGTSMKQVEQALDMRPGSLYATFGSKDGLFQEALDVYANRTAANLEAHIRQDPSLISGLKNYLREVALSCTGGSKAPARACLITKTLLELNAQDSPLRAQVNQVLDSIETQFTAILEEALRRGELHRDADCQRIARLLQAQIMGLRSFAQREISSSQVEHLAEDIASILDHYVSPNA